MSIRRTFQSHWCFPDTAAFAAAAAYARRVVQQLADVESAVLFYADKVQAGEYRQDRAAGLQNDADKSRVGSERYP